MKKKEDETQNTKFQGAVSMDAIFAATSTAKEIKIDTPIVKETAVEEVVPVVVDTPVVDETPVVVDTPPIVPKPVTPGVKAEESTETDFFKKAKELISLGLLEDFSIQASDDDEEGTPISEFTSMSEEDLSEIIKIHKEGKKEDLSSNYISKKGLKEHQVKIIEILENGGDLSQIAESPEKAFDRPFEGYDMDERQRQVDVLYVDLTNGKGLDHESAITLIEKSVAKGTLEDEAKEVFGTYRNAHAKYVDDILEGQKKDKEFKDLNFKENKKALTAKLKSAGLKEGVYKKVSNEYAKKNEKGEFALVDKLKEILSKPEENHELILHLVDKKLFNDTFKIKASQETQRTVVRLASRAASKGNKKVQSSAPQEAQAPWLVAAAKYNESVKQ